MMTTNQAIATIRARMLREWVHMGAFQYDLDLSALQHLERIADRFMSMNDFHGYEKLCEDGRASLKERADFLLSIVDKAAQSAK